MAGPRACYDEGKRVSETLSYAYAKQENVNVRVARIFNTYGPRMHMNDGRVVSNFILQALQNESITVRLTTQHKLKNKFLADKRLFGFRNMNGFCPTQIYGNGKQTRSFQYISDLIDGLVALMGSNYTQPVNIGNPVEHTIEGKSNEIKQNPKRISFNFVSFSTEFAIIIRDLVGGKTSKMETMPAVEDDPQRRKPDISRAKKVINWEPRVPLKVGLEKTIEYFRKELERSKHSNRNVYVPKQEQSQQNRKELPKDGDDRDDVHTDADAGIEQVLHVNNNLK